MPTPGKHKTVQASILEYAEAISEAYDIRPKYRIVSTAKTASV